MNDEIDRLRSALADRYTIEREIGSGGMAIVYLAEEVKHHRMVAIKVLRPELAAALGTERFVREIETTANLTHPNILPLLDSGSVEKQPTALLFYVMPFIEGESLRDRIDREEKLPLEDVVRLSENIAAALTHAHRQGIVHRDVKPENILITGGKAVVADFGIARAVTAAGGTRLTETGMAIGTPAYMSPEQAFGDANIDGRSDVYALGCIVYEMASGRTPFDAPTPQALLAKHAVDTPRGLRTIDPDIPLFVERAVERALAKEPARRFNTPNELAETLRSQTVVAQTGRRRIAVLPPTNLTNDPEQDYFVAGMHNALISELQQVGIAVIARTSVLQYENTQKPIHLIATELGVDALIEPSVFRAEDSVELEVRVVDGNTEEYLADPIARGGQLENVVALYRELTGEIAKEIHATLTPQAEARLAIARPVNPDAYDAFLKGQFHCWRLTPTDLDRAFECFQRALSLDPEYALAQAGIAWVWFARGQMAFAMPGEAAAQASAAVSRALELDSTLSDVQGTVALVRTWQEWDLVGGETAFRNAIEINPNNATTRASYSALLAQMKRPDEARAQVERALELDPFSPVCRMMKGHVSIFARRYAESIEALEDALRIEPDNRGVYDNLSSAYQLNGDYENALRLVRKFFPGDQELENALDEGYEKGGYRTALVRWADTLCARPGVKEVMSYFIAGRYAWAGDKERTLELLELAYETRNPNMTTLNSPEFDLVRDEPRFQAMVRKIGLPE